MYKHEAPARPAELETAVPAGRRFTSYTKKKINNMPLKIHCPICQHPTCERFK
jgi:hypothetical protein